MPFAIGLLVTSVLTFALAIYRAFKAQEKKDRSAAKTAKKRKDHTDESMQKTIETVFDSIKTK